MENEQKYLFYNNVNIAKYFSIFSNLFKGLSEVYFPLNKFNDLSFHFMFSLNKINMPLNNTETLKFSYLKEFNSNLNFYLKEIFEYADFTNKNKNLSKYKLSVLINNFQPRKKKVITFLEKKILSSALNDHVYQKLSSLILIFNKYFKKKISFTHF